MLVRFYRFYLFRYLAPGRRVIGEIRHLVIRPVLAGHRQGASIGIEHPVQTGLTIEIVPFFVVGLHVCGRNVFSPAGQHSQCHRAQGRRDNECREDLGLFALAILLSSSLIIFKHSYPSLQDRNFGPIPQITLIIARNEDLCS